MCGGIIGSRPRRPGRFSRLTLSSVGDGDVAEEPPALLDASLFCSGHKVAFSPEDTPTLCTSNDNVVQDTWCIESGLSGPNGNGPE